MMNIPCISQNNITIRNFGDTVRDNSLVSKNNANVNELRNLGEKILLCFFFTLPLSLCDLSLQIINRISHADRHWATINQKLNLWFEISIQFAMQRTLRWCL